MKKDRRGGLVRGVFGLGLMVAVATSAGAEAPVKAGLLTCKSLPDTRSNLIVHSTVEVQCTFARAGGGEEHYQGETGVQLGVDLKWEPSQTLRYAVFSAGKPSEHALAGKYFGGKASAAAGVGAGANVLIGGGSNGITLNPIALETSTGVGVSAGMAYLYLEPKDA